MIKWILYMLGMYLFWTLVRFIWKKIKEGRKTTSKKKVNKKEILARKKRMLIAIPLAVIILAVGSFNFYTSYMQYYLKGEEISTLEFKEKLNSEEPIEKIVMMGDTWSVQWQDGTINKVNNLMYYTTKFGLAAALPKMGTDIVIKPPLSLNLMIHVLLAGVFIALIFLFIFWWPKIMKGGTFIKILIKGIEEWSKITFAQVGANKEVKQKLSAVIKFLKEPEKFKALGAKMPRGILLSGPPGCGKTYIARALAGEAGVPYLSMVGSEFVEVFVGVGASKVRELFGNAKKLAKSFGACIVFIDEIDAFGKKRSGVTGVSAPHEEEGTLTQLLSEMDGFDPATGILVLAATNRPDVLDPALLRPGRFDIKVEIPVPDRQGRKEILEVHAQGKPIKVGVDFDKIAAETTGLTGADMENIVNEATLRVVNENRSEIEQKDLEAAVDRVTMGQEKKGQRFSQKEREITAFHEVGHALVAKALPAADPVRRVSIVPRVEGAGGFTRIAAAEDLYILTRKRALTLLAVMLGGRAAEIVALDLLSTGAGQDLLQATELAKAMVCFYGMSERIGPQFLTESTEIYTGQPVKDYSERTAKIVDEEVGRLISEALEKAKEILRRNRGKLEEARRVLIEEKETLTDKEFDEIVGEVS